MRFMFSPMTAMLALVPAVLPVQAATCNGSNVFVCVSQDGALAFRSDVWAARDDYCGNDRWKNQSCYKHVGTGINKTPIYINLDHPGWNNRQTCYDALENIINQCNGDGTYEYNGAHYRLTWCTLIKPC